MNSVHQEWLLKIARCREAQLCFDAGETTHPCHSLVKIQHVASINLFQVPEPWSGRLGTAPLLFVSSNPGYSEADEYPHWREPDSELLDFFEHRFELFIEDGVRGLRRDRLPPAPTRFWVSVKNLASELLGEKVRPGEDYALTEVVHCKSVSENQGGAASVWKAVEKCSPLYTRQVLALSGAKVVVVLGSIAKWAFEHYVGVLAPETKVLGPLLLEGKERHIAFLPHPNAHQRRTFEACVAPADLERLRKVLAVERPGIDPSIFSSASS